MSTLVPVADNRQPGRHLLHLDANGYMYLVVGVGATVNYPVPVWLNAKIGTTSVVTAGERGQPR
jgi:hypothetical protein